MKAYRPPVYVDDPRVSWAVLFLVLALCLFGLGITGWQMHYLHADARPLTGWERRNP